MALTFFILLSPSSLFMKRACEGGMRPAVKWSHYIVTCRAVTNTMHGFDWEKSDTSFRIKIVFTRR